MPLTTAEANALLNASTNNAAYSFTTACKLALDTANGTAGSAGTEVGGGSYARQTATFGTAASAGSIANTVAITYAGMPACTVTGCEVYDSAGTNRKWYGSLTTSRTLLAGDSLSFAISALTLSLT